jgi:hypothetical protein
MRIGILGSGLMGGKLGTLVARAGHEVIFSYSRSQEKLKQLARNAGGNARVGTPREAMESSGVILLAVNWWQMDDLLKQAGDLSGKIVVSSCYENAFSKNTKQPPSIPKSTNSNKIY